MPGDVTIHLVRHGETLWNAEHRIQGMTPDVPLTKLGEAQADTVADTLSGRPIGAVIASDLLRAIQTATPLAERLGLLVRTDPALREKDFGALEGLRADEIDPETRELMRRQWSEPDLVVAGGETVRHLYDRLGGFLRGLIAAPPAAEVAVVAHGGSVRVAVAYLNGLPAEEVGWLAVDNGSIRTFSFPVGIDPGPPDWA